MFDVYHATDALTNPEWLLTRFDPDARQFTFVETTRDILLSSAFIDGRTPLSLTNRVATVDLREASARCGSNAARAPFRIIAHVGFCGSSLLAHALDATGVCLTYKEPQAITDLSALKTAHHPIAQTEAWPHIVDVAASQFMKSFPGLTPVLKLSNWPVNLLPELCAKDARIVFMSTTPRDYLLAILRGGRERSWFILQFIQKLRREFPAVDATIQILEREASGKRWQVILRGALVALIVQEQMFERLSAALGAARSRILQSDALTSMPDETLEQVAETLALPIRRVHRRRAIREAFANASKQPWAKFDASAHAGSNARLLSLFGGEIDEALRWCAVQRFNLL